MRDPSLCEICGQAPSGRVRVLSYDHDHKNGQSRGRLCFSCNVGLGHFRDDVAMLEAAIVYLKYWKQEHDELINRVRTLRNSA